MELRHNGGRKQECSREEFAKVQTKLCTLTVNGLLLQIFTHFWFLTMYMCILQQFFSCLSVQAKNKTKKIQKCL